ncbi:unnamed protein product [Urochloa humidicola]
MSFRTLPRLRSIALQPAAGHTMKPLKPTAANATVPNITAAVSYKLLLPRISFFSAYTSPLPVAARSFLARGTAPPPRRRRRQRSQQRKKRTTTS